MEYGASYGGKQKCHMFNIPQADGCAEGGAVCACSSEAGQISGALTRDSSTMISRFSPRKEANYSTSLYMARLQDISSDLLNSTCPGRAGCGNGLNGPWSRFVKRMGRSEGELLWIYDHSWTGFSRSWPGRQQSYSPTITNHSNSIVSCGT